MIEFLKCRQLIEIHLKFCCQLPDKARDILRLIRSLRKRKLFRALLLVGFGVALVTSSGLVKLHDEILKASLEERDQAIQIASDLLVEGQTM